MCWGVEISERRKFLQRRTLVVGEFERQGSGVWLLTTIMRHITGHVGVRGVRDYARLEIMHDFRACRV